MIQVPIAWFSNADEFATIDGVSQKDAEVLWFEQGLEGFVEPAHLKNATEHLPLGDNPNTGLVYPKCLSEKAYLALKSVIDECGFTRRAEIDDTPFFLFWPSIVLDCIDFANSKIAEMTSGYRRLIQPRFLPFRDTPPPIFRAKGFEQQCVFVSQATAEIFKDAGLCGIELQTVMGDNPEYTRLECSAEQSSGA